MKIRELFVEHDILIASHTLSARCTRLEEKCNFSANVFSSSSVDESFARDLQAQMINDIQDLTFDSEIHKGYTVSVLMELLDSSRIPIHVSIFQKKIIDILVDQICMIIHGTVTDQLMEAGAQRYINGVANDWFDKLQSGKIQLDPNAKEKLEKLVQ